MAMMQYNYTIHYRTGEKEVIRAVGIQRGGDEWAFLTQNGQYDTMAFLFIPKALVARVEVEW
jgi:hypothetical protein